MQFAYLLVLSLGCGPKVPAPLPETAAAPAPVRIEKAKAVKVAGLLDLRCTAQACFVTVSGGRHAIDASTLKLGVLQDAPTPIVPAIRLNETPDPLAARWNRQIARGWRSPFQEQIPTRTGGRVSYMRSMQDGAARLVRVGGGMRAQPAPRAQNPAAYRRWLALHPSGEQAYLAPWPHTEIIAIDPDQLLTGWRLDMGEPTLGLFVDGTGSYLVGETGAVPTEDRMLDYSGHPIAVAENEDPAGDPFLAQIPRPIGTHTIIIDLKRQVIIARLPGSFMRWVPVQGAALVATTRAVARLPIKSKP